jgi:hypothetical protein
MTAVKNVGLCNHNCSRSNVVTYWTQTTMGMCESTVFLQEENYNLHLQQAVSLDIFFRLNVCSQCHHQQGLNFSFDFTGFRETPEL